MGLDDFITSESEKYFIIEYPNPKEATEKIKKTWKSYLLVLFARARVFYEGRAESKLTWADHLIITKPDGTLLVHSRTKREPVNWQPPGCIINSFIEDDHIIIVSKRHRPREIVRIEIKTLYFLIGIRPGKGYFDKFLSESQMVDFVIRNPDIIEPGFIPIQKEVHIKYGYVDLLGRDTNGNLVILEFKRRRADIQDVAQLALYVEILKRENTSKIRGILVAPGISSNASLLLRDKGLEFREFNIKTLLSTTKNSKQEKKTQQK